MFYNVSISRSLGLHRGFHTSRVSPGLEEFFDNEKNWNVKEVRVGRGWALSDLRPKSNQDLHKLWFVLLKEYNMLLTMEYNLETLHGRTFPNPERIDKVQESMENIETVVKERNKAYYQLEVCETEDGCRPIKHQRNQFGILVDRPLDEHAEPETEATKFPSRDPRKDEDVAQFLALLEEKEENEKKKLKEQRFRHVVKLFHFFEDLDVEQVKREYPDVDVELARRDKGARANRENPF